MRIGLVAGESSGDLLGAGLIRAIRERFPDARFEGVAGPEMVAAGCTAWEPAESLAVMGLVEPLAHIPRLLRLRRSLVRRWIDAPPDVFVGIDAPDFNLGLEKRLRAHGVRTVHYVSPSVWAWRSGRVRT
ncbi:MAG: lipid-A-disaccharide synthase, partial [Pseudomonadota bacterium]